MSTYQSRLLIIAAVPQLKIVMGAKFYDSVQISAHKKIRDYMVVFIPTIDAPLRKSKYR